MNQTQYEVNERIVNELEKRRGLSPTVASALLNRMNIADNSKKPAQIYAHSHEGRGFSAYVTRMGGIKKFLKHIKRDVSHKEDYWEIHPCKNPVTVETTEAVAAA